MPKKVVINPALTDHLVALGERMRAQRKSLRVSATVAAEAAGISRVTLHRVEKGEPAVTMGAYLAVAMTLGLKLGLTLACEQPASAATERPTGEAWIPARIRLADHPQLAQLAWQTHGTEMLTAREAWDIYERNRRHLDESALTERERQLIDALRLGFGDHPDRV